MSKQSHARFQTLDGKCARRLMKPIRWETPTPPISSPKFRGALTNGFGSSKPIPRRPTEELKMKHEVRSRIPASRRTVPIASRDHVQGRADAALTLLEYGDYECPYCGDAHPVVQTVQKLLGDRLCFAYRNFPLV